MLDVRLLTKTKGGLKEPLVIAEDTLAIIITTAIQNVQFAHTLKRATIEEAILEGRATVEDFAAELDIEESALFHHMEKHTKPLIQTQVSIEALQKQCQRLMSH